MVAERRAMQSTDTEGSAPPRLAEAPPDNAVTEHIRGSSLLVAGRLIAYALEFVAQVFIIRVLSKSAFGDFAYALSIAVALKSIIILALPDTVARFIPYYRERGMYGAVLGSSTCRRCCSAHPSEGPQCSYHRRLVMGALARTRMFALSQDITFFRLRV